MSKNWACSKCGAYNHPRRQACWQCRTPIYAISPAKQPTSARGKWSRFLPLFAIMITALVCVALVIHRWFLAATTPPIYELNWKIEEGQPIAYSATLQITNSNIAVDFGKLFDTEQLDQNANFSFLAAAFENVTSTPSISFSLPAYSVVSILEKNPRSMLPLSLF